MTFDTDNSGISQILHLHLIQQKRKLNSVSTQISLAHIKKSATVNFHSSACNHNFEIQSSSSGKHKNNGLFLPHKVWINMLNSGVPLPSTLYMAVNLLCAPFLSLVAPYSTSFFCTCANYLNLASLTLSLNHGKSKNLNAFSAWLFACITVSKPCIIVALTTTLWLN